MIPETSTTSLLSQGSIASSPGVFDFQYSITGQHKPKHRGIVTSVHFHRRSPGNGLLAAGSRRLVSLSMHTAIQDARDERSYFLLRCHRLGQSCSKAAFWQLL